jgi:hypothetical protein
MNLAANLTTKQDDLIERIVALANRAANTLNELCAPDGAISNYRSIAKLEANDYRELLTQCAQSNFLKDNFYREFAKIYINRGGTIPPVYPENLNNPNEAENKYINNILDLTKNSFPLVFSSAKDSCLASQIALIEKSGVGKLIDDLKHDLNQLSSSNSDQEVTKLLFEVLGQGLALAASSLEAPNADSTDALLGLFDLLKGLKGHLEKLQVPTGTNTSVGSSISNEAVHQASEPTVILTPTNSKIEPKVVNPRFTPATTALVGLFKGCWDFDKDCCQPFDFSRSALLIIERELTKNEIRKCLIDELSDEALQDNLYVASFLLYIEKYQADRSRRDLSCLVADLQVDPNLSGPMVDALIKWGLGYTKVEETVFSLPRNLVNSVAAILVDLSGRQDTLSDDGFKNMCSATARLLGMLHSKGYSDEDALLISIEIMNQVAADSDKSTTKELIRTTGRTVKFYTEINRGKLPSTSDINWAGVLGEHEKFKKELAKIFAKAARIIEELGMSEAEVRRFIDLHRNSQRPKLNSPPIFMSDTVSRLVAIQNLAKSSSSGVKDQIATWVKTQGYTNAADFFDDLIHVTAEDFDGLLGRLTSSLSTVPTQTNDHKKSISDNPADSPTREGGDDQLRNQTEDPVVIALIEAYPELSIKEIFEVEDIATALRALWSHASKYVNIDTMRTLHFDRQGKRLDASIRWLKKNDLITSPNRNTVQLMALDTSKTGRIRDALSNRAKNTKPSTKTRQLRKK